MSVAAQKLRSPTVTSYEDVSAVQKQICELTSVEHLVEPDAQLSMAHDPRDARSEAVRSLRTELLLRFDPADRSNIIALLSPRAGEGRSRLAADLAIAFAQTGRPTLLVDADLRRPQQHRNFRTDNQSGLAQAIEFGERPLLHSVRGVPRMSVLTSGATPDDPLQLFSSATFASMIDGWREEFRFVVVDTAPVAEFADGLAVASLVGQVLVLSRAQHTPYGDMQHMLRRLTATRAQILGAVMNHF